MQSYTDVFWYSAQKAICDNINFLETPENDIYLSTYSSLRMKISAFWSNIVLLHLK